LESFQIGRDTLEYEINFAGQHPAFPHQRLCAHEFFECNEIGFRLAREMHHREDRDLVAKLFLIQQRAIPLDVPGLFQRADPTQTGRRRNADAACQFDIGDAAVCLQLLEYLEVDGIETGWQRTNLWTSED